MRRTASGMTRVAAVGLVLAGLASAGRAVAAPTDTAGAVGEASPVCVELARRMYEKPALHWSVELLMEIEAYKTTKRIVDSLGSSSKLGPGWKEGERRWERAYALLQPDVLRLLRVAGAYERKRQRATVASRLDPATCRKIVDLWATPEGDAASRALMAEDVSKMLADAAGQLPPRLDRKRASIEGELQKEKALLDAPEVRSEAKKYQTARSLVRQYDQKLLEATRDPLVEIDEPGPDNRAAGGKLMEQNRAKLVAIIQEFQGDAK